MIAGFVISGNKPKTILIRGIGPSLAAFGVPGVISAVHLDLYRGSSKVFSADDWGAASNAADIATAARRVGAFEISPVSRDSAILVTLQPGLYSAHLRGQGGATGVSMVEVYDATDGDIPLEERLINISTRGWVGTGAEVQIAGFVILGDVPKRVLVRGVGPALDAWGVPGFLEDPVITLYDSAGNPIATNDNWGDAGDSNQIQAMAAQVGAFALTPGSNDAVLLINLDPGIYSVHVRGKAGTTGITLVEVYDTVP